MYQVHNLHLSLKKKPAYLYFLLPQHTKNKHNETAQNELSELCSLNWISFFSRKYHIALQALPFFWCKNASA